MIEEGKRDCMERRRSLLMSFLNVKPILQSSYLRILVIYVSFIVWSNVIGQVVSVFSISLPLYSCSLFLPLLEYMEGKASLDNIKIMMESK